MDLIKRAERAGYKAFAVTVDTPQLGRREADIRNKFSLPAHLTMGNFAGMPLLYPNMITIHDYNPYTQKPNHTYLTLCYPTCDGANPFSNPYEP